MRGLKQGLFIFASLGLLCVSLESMAHDDAFYTIASKEIELVAENDQDLPFVLRQKSSKSMEGVGEVLAIANEIIALGERIYALIEKGRPVLNTDYTPISVLPTTRNGQAINMLDMEGWSAPRSRTYKITYKNLYGMEVVTFEYTIMFSFGGSYEGKGKYLTAAQIVPSSVNVLWGYSMTAQMKLAGIQNHGTKSNPVAGAVLLLEYTVSTVMKANKEVEKFHITGNGELTIH